LCAGVVLSQPCGNPLGEQSSQESVVVPMCANDRQKWRSLLTALLASLKERFVKENDRRFYSLLMFGCVLAEVFFNHTPSTQEKQATHG